MNTFPLNCGAEGAGDGRFYRTAIGVLIHSLKQPFQIKAMRSRGVTHIGASAFDNHVNDRKNVSKLEQLNTFVCEIYVVWHIVDGMRLLKTRMGVQRVASC